MMCGALVRNEGEVVAWTVVEKTVSCKRREPQNVAVRDVAITVTRGSLTRIQVRKLIEICVWN